MEHTVGWPLVSANQVDISFTCIPFDINFEGIELYESVLLVVNLTSLIYFRVFVLL